MRSEADKAAAKAKRKEQDDLNYKIATAAEELESQLNEDMQARAELLGVEISALRARFLMYASHRCDTQPTIWNGLVHVKSEEWADMKEKYPGRAFLAYVVERIHNEDLYDLAKMSDEEQDQYIRAAQDARKAKLNAGVAKTSSERFVQGTVKNEIGAICNRLQYLHAATSIECLLFVVKGKAQDGLAPTYHASDKARTFLESHLKAPVAHLLDLMESSSIGGSAALALCHQTKTQLIKSRVRRAMLMSCRTAVTSVADDGSPPVVTEPLDIGMIEYKNYISFAKENKVIMEGWPVKPDGSLVDPSSMGLGKLETLLKLLENPNSGCGFKCLTENEWKEWTEKLDQDIKAGKVILPSRKTRSDAGKKRRHDAFADSNEGDGSKTQRKENSKPKPKKASAPKAKGSRASKQKKSPTTNQILSSDSAETANPGTTSDGLSHAANNDRPTEVQDVAPDDQHDDLPAPAEIMQMGPPVAPMPNTQHLQRGLNSGGAPELPEFPEKGTISGRAQGPIECHPSQSSQSSQSSALFADEATFNFRAIDAHPTAPQWPVNHPRATSTPQASQIGFEPRATGAREYPRPGPGTPKRDYRFVVSTPEQQAARANSPRRPRSCSPATPTTPTMTRTRPIPRNPVADIPIDPQLMSARIIISNVASE
ncbi:hypothetical protein RSOLAG22IIIB_10489 [Rhizoctonia solani]|uniref:Uncharacterized protein n=1 Tax=Rhizoctonia solani TaxID=456999 RepID=A0A0K6G3E1_9AGAM|nr:hypothetical protein RSOLAG22IIIB_10489 [Rhizoctonia solani]